MRAIIVFAYFVSDEVIRVFDGNASMKKRLYRTISVPKNAPVRALLVSRQLYVMCVAVCYQNV